MPGPSPTRILLVEDSPTHSQLIGAALAAGERPIELTVASSLTEGRRLCSANPPDLMIVDLMLPDGRGTELLALDFVQQPLPVLIMTSQGNEEEAVKAMKAGALDYLVKSSTMLAELPRAVDRALREWEHICQRRNAEETLRMSEARWRSMFEVGAAGMVLVSPEGVLLEVNPCLCRWLGYEEKEVIGRPVTDFVHEEDRERTRRNYVEISSVQRGSIHEEKRYLRKDGSTFWGQISLSCVYDAAKSPRYCIGLIQDISGRIAMEEELRKANRELDAFVHTVSHDLRTPLTPIIGYAQLLERKFDSVLDETARSYLEVIVQQGLRMELLLADLLVLAQVGHLERPLTAVATDEIVSSVVTAREGQLAAAGMAVTSSPLPPTRLPATLLSQLFDNLIGNAIRYAESGRRIEISGTRQGDRVGFAIADHGPGIPPAEREQVFELFYRSAATAMRQGSGVGLATVRKIADLYNGRVWVEETPGGGCTFRIELEDPL